MPTGPCAVLDHARVPRPRRPTVRRCGRRPRRRAGCRSPAAARSRGCRWSRRPAPRPSRSRNSASSQSVDRLDRRDRPVVDVTGDDHDVDLLPAHHLDQVSRGTRPGHRAGRPGAGNGRDASRRCGAAAREKARATLRQFRCGARTEQAAADGRHSRRRAGSHRSGPAPDPGDRAHPSPGNAPESRPRRDGRQDRAHAGGGAAGAAGRGPRRRPGGRRDRRRVCCSSSASRTPTARTQAVALAAQGAHAADPRRRTLRRRVRRPAARGQPVHALRRHPQGSAALLERRGARAGRRAPGSARSSRSCATAGATVATGVFGADMQVGAGQRRAGDDPARGLILLEHRSS